MVVLAITCYSFSIKMFYFFNFVLFLRLERLTREILTNYLMLGSLHLLLLLHHPGSLLLDPPPPLLLLLNLLPPLLILLITINIKRVMVVVKVSFTMTKRITVPR